MPARLRQMIRSTHQQNAGEPIVGPNEAGVFPDSSLRSVPPVVADANVLCRDVLRACREPHHTVLVNAVNAGMIRLYCAQHVVDEMEKHAEKWSTDAGISPDRFLECWESKYVPLIRLVEVEDGLLSPEEQQRIALLEHGPPEMCDPDDVPSATLALQLDAFFLSQDKKPLWAVYGEDVDLERHHNWLATLCLAGDAGVGGQVSEWMTKAPVLVGEGMFLALKWVWENISPWVAVGAVGIGGFALHHVSPERGRKALDAAGKFMEMVVELQRFYGASTVAFRHAAPEVPSWAHLATTNDPDAVLTRASLCTLARAPMTHRSAAELADDLPDLPVARSEAKVRSMLRRRDCFDSAYDGRWQVGRAAALPP